MCTYTYIIHSMCTYAYSLSISLTVPPLINVLGKANVPVWLTSQTVDFNSPSAKHKHFLEQPEQIEAKNAQWQIVPVWLGLFSLFLACLSYQYDSPCHPPSLPTWTVVPASLRKGLEYWYGWESGWVSVNRTRMITPTRDTKKGNRTSMTDLANTDTGKRNRTGMISFAPQSAFTIVPVLLIKVLEYSLFKETTIMSRG